MGTQRVQGNRGAGTRSPKGHCGIYEGTCVRLSKVKCHGIKRILSFRKIDLYNIADKRRPNLRFRKCLANLPLSPWNSVHSRHDPACLRACAQSGGTNGGGSRPPGWPHPVTCVSVCLVPHLSKEGLRCPSMAREGYQ